MKAFEQINNGLSVAHRFMIRQAKRLSERQLMVVIAFVVGVVAAIAAYIFEWIVEEIRTWLSEVVNADSVNLLYFVMPVVGIVLVTIFVKYIVKDDISHGVTRVLYAITHSGSKLKSHNTYSSIVAGATTIAFGGSVGPEAPMVMTGAAVGSNIGRFFRMNYRNTTILLGCGTAAGLAAIFKAPIAGVIFVLEVLMLNVTLFSIIPILIAAVTSTTIIYFLNGFEPHFSVGYGDTILSIDNMPYYILLGIFCGLVSYYLIASSGYIEKHFKKITSQYKKWLVGGSALGLLIFLLPPLYGQGYNIISLLIDRDTNTLFNNTLFYSMRDNVWVLLAYLAAIICFKSIAMACTNAAGGVGGAFAPSLFVGAFAGYFFATLLNSIFGLELPVVSFVLVGMAGVMSGSMNSPLTAVFLIAEITGGYRLFVPLMLVSAMAFAICYYFTPFSVYTRDLVMKGDITALSSERSMLFLDLANLVEEDFSTVHEDMTLGDMVDVVATCKRNIFPVVDEARHLVGVVTLDDIRSDMFDHSLYSKNHVSDYMSLPPATITMDDPVGDVLDKFDRSGAWNLPVLTSDGRYQGFVSKSKIFSEYRSELASNA
ncbi:MAG: chloride channel protein [Rikenellaceae bacterium]|nr:chloride channel protein [Rikenellaceae bacterium]